MASYLPQTEVRSVSRQAGPEDDLAPRPWTRHLPPSFALTSFSGLTRSPGPHVTILQWVQDNLAAGAGLSLNIKEIDDYQTPNTSLDDGSLAANIRPSRRRASTSTSVSRT